MKLFQNKGQFTRHDKYLFAEGDSLFGTRQRHRKLSVKVAQLRSKPTESRSASYWEEILHHIGASMGLRWDCFNLPLFSTCWWVCHLFQVIWAKKTQEMLLYCTVYLCNTCFITFCIYKLSHAVCNIHRFLYFLKTILIVNQDKYMVFVYERSLIILFICTSDRFWQNVSCFC